MVYKFTIPGRMPNLNDFIKAERTTIRTNKGTHKMLTQGAVMKRKWQAYVLRCIHRDLSGVKAVVPIDIHYHYFEPDKRRDKGNIHAFSQKIIEDALQDAKVIPNDGWNEIRNFSAEFDVDSANPRIEVTIKEI